MVKNLVTIILVILCISATIYAWSYYDTQYIFDEYGFSTNNLLSGKLWVLITSIFLHSDINHLVLNLIALLVFGTILEKEIGSKKILILFLFGAFIGDFLSSLFYPLDVSSIGASAGIFAIMTAALLIKPVQIEAYIPIPIGVIALGYIASMIVGLITGTPEGVSHIGHLGGALVGLFYGFKVKGSKSGLRIITAIFLIFLFVPVIWNTWVLIVNFLTSLF
jgi:membrane associated rhomboid family serine protease